MLVPALLVPPLLDAIGPAGSSRRRERGLVVADSFVVCALAAAALAGVGLMPAVVPARALLPEPTGSFGWLLGSIPSGIGCSVERRERSRALSRPRALSRLWAA